jgi:MoaA/NifB/PqqE/SkfB family radical SAM enzyme
MTNKIDIEKQDIVQGSAHLYNSESQKKFDKIQYMSENMEFNLAYKFHLEKIEKSDKDKSILKSFKERYKKYRSDWLESPNKQYLDHSEFLSTKGQIPNPLCVDIETASICDLGCPHCFRDYIMTPDKIMSEDLFNKIIQMVSELEIPSIKLNWRGEPLLNPKLCKFITQAKKKNILEVMINTNATKLDAKMSENLIKSGLDQIIFSFDGGTKRTYDKMRPGRFSENTFEKVYSNIKQFAEIRKKLNSKFPTTKIQMVLTKDTREEIKDFYKLFNDYVDDVTVIHYHERGGNMSQLNKKNKEKIINYTSRNGLSSDTPFMVTADEQVYLSTKRKSCPQIFQRLMVTYDGKVGMCCHDWGAKHCIGYLDKQAFNEEKVLNDLEKSIKINKKGFELLKNAKKPKNLSSIKKKVEDISDVWCGSEITKIRNIHAKQKANEIEICKGCVSTDTYEWFKI